MAESEATGPKAIEETAAAAQDRSPGAPLKTGWGEDRVRPPQEPSLPSLRETEALRGVDVRPDG